MHATFTTRARIYLALTAAALLVSAVALPLALRARGNHTSAQTLVTEELVFAASVAEIRVLALQVQGAALQAALRPEDAAFSARFAAEHHLLAEELRRARLHAPDHDAVDVVDEMENSVLRFAAAAERVFAAADAHNEVAARAAVIGFDEERRLQEELSEELATIAGTAADQRARGLSGGGQTAALFVLALVALVLAAEAFLLAAGESGRAIALLLSGVTPDRWQHYLPWEDPRPAPAATARPGVERGAGDGDEDDEEEEQSGPQPVYVLKPEQASAMAAALKPAGQEKETEGEASAATSTAEAAANPQPDREQPPSAAA